MCVIKNLVKLISLSLLIVLASCSAIEHNKKISIALMIPLSGEEGKQGQKLRDVFLTGVEATKRQDIDVVIYDVSRPEQAIEAVKNAASKGIKVVAGPMYSKHVKAIDSLAKANDMVVITFSNDPVLARDNVLVYGHAPFQQTERVLDYLINKGYKNYILLFPSSQYSHNNAAIIQAKLVRNNATVIRSEFYQDYPEALEKSVLSVAESVENINEDDTNTQLPVILVSDNSDKILSILEYGKKERLDDNAIIAGDWRVNVNYKGDANYIYTGSLNHEDPNITKRLQEKFGSNYLNHLETITYDLGLIIASSMSKTFDKGLFLNRLQDNDGFVGISGLVRFKNNMAERKYDVIQRKGQEFEVIDYAPSAFKK